MEKRKKARTKSQIRKQILDKARSKAQQLRLSPKLSHSPDRDTEQKILSKYNWPVFMIKDDDRKDIDKMAPLLAAAIMNRVVTLIDVKPNLKDPATTDYIVLRIATHPEVSKKELLYAVGNIIDTFLPQGKRRSRLKEQKKALEVWELWSKAGQKPWQRTFGSISKKVKRPLSTVKSQWRRAYELIYDRPYDPLELLTSEKKRAEADALCVKCPCDGFPCYKNDKNLSKGGTKAEILKWVPCSDYIRIAGREFPKSKVLPYSDELSCDDEMS